MFSNQIYTLKPKSISNNPVMFVFYAKNPEVSKIIKNEQDKNQTKMAKIGQF